MGIEILFEIIPAGKSRFNGFMAYSYGKAAYFEPNPFNFCIVLIKIFVKSYCILNECSINCFNK